MKKTQILALLLFLKVFHASAGIVVDGTRVIYPQGKKEVSLGILNVDEHTPYLIQAWVENFDKSNKEPPFIITPPLFRLNAGQRNSVRITSVGSELAKDRETVFWLNVKNISPSSAANSNQLHVNIKSKFKLFYRPEGLTGNPEDAYKEIIFVCKDSKMMVRNPTPYFVSFGELNVSGTKIKDPGMVHPLSELTWPIACGRHVSWQAINDYGGFTIVHEQLLPLKT